MLILTRKPNETIRIGDDIILTVLALSGQQTRLGITAPAGVAVHRQEVYERIRAEAVVAGQATDTPDPDASVSIDERVKMAADARRYRHLRDRTLIEDVDNELLVLRGDRNLTGEELDQEVDNALRLARLEELHPCAD